MAAEDRYYIYQLKPGDENHGRRFANWNTMFALGDVPDIKNYELTYSAPLEPDMTLEDIYYTLNMERPEDFHGHSLSVSDIVVTETVAGARAFYVDSLGFKEHSFFVPQHEKHIQAEHEQEETRMNNRQESYAMLQQIAPEIVDGSCTYVKMQAGEGFMPLSIEQLYDNRYAMMHSYIQNGDLMRDPDMEFVIDHDKKSIQALTFRTDGALALDQSVEMTPSPALQRELDTFFNQWVHNIDEQDYRKEKMHIIHQGRELTLEYGENGQLEKIRGDKPLVDDYAKKHNLDLEPNAPQVTQQTPAAAMPLDPER